MRIAYISTFNPKDIKNSWSGTGYYLAQALEKSTHSVTYIAPLYEQYELLAKMRQQIYRSVFHKKHLRGFDRSIIKGYASQIQKSLRIVKADVLFSVWSTPIALLDTDIPIAFTADAVFQLMSDFYPDWSNISTSTKRNGLSADIEALQRSKAAIYPSDWASEGAIERCNADKNKVHVIPYGANIANEFIPDSTSVVRSTTGENCSLLFLGVDWIRKGGNIAYETMKELCSIGISTTLTICGCVPPNEVRTDSRVTVIPFLNKNNPNDLSHLTELLRSSSFLLLPTRAEAYGIVFCEASAFGLPSITTSVGGVTTAVHDNVNGKLLPLTADYKEYAQCIAELWNDKKAYTELSYSSRKRYEDELNWDIAGKRIVNILEGLVN